MEIMGVDRPWHMWQLLIRLDGSEIWRSAVEVASLSHYLRRDLYIPGGDRQISEPSTVWLFTSMVISTTGKHRKTYYLFLCNCLVITPKPESFKGILGGDSPSQNHHLG